MLNDVVLLWYNKGTSDKLWGIVRVGEKVQPWEETKYLIFWGKRGKKLGHTVRDMRKNDVSNLVYGKEDKGYSRVQFGELVFKQTEEDIEKMVLWAKIGI